MRMRILGVAALMTLTFVFVSIVSQDTHLTAATTTSLALAHERGTGETIEQIQGGTMWRGESNKCIQWGSGKARETTKRGDEGRPASRTSWLQLEERLRSLDAYLDAQRMPNPQWHLTPANALKHTRHDGIFMASYKDKIKARRIWDSVTREGLRMDNFCEIGVSLGHSTLLWLEANPEGCVFVFDLPDENAFEPLMRYALQYFKLVYTERIVIVQGDHKDTTPALANRSKVKCDSIAIDGPKDIKGRELDYRLFQLLAHTDTLLFIDDTAPEEVVDLSIPSENLRTDTDRVTRRWLEAGKLEVVQVWGLPWKENDTWIAAAATRNSRIYPSAEMGHGTLIAKYKE
eukprot:TRINITY_DN21114_c0_g1_i1.p1 TRINITY_DN21114_c0_g1~~TRINITY_DN21114_c0_g1_i1.p1  ORF type:complete len:365 (+),score=25.43 TRINITY_DN21114_c0_g1_i1:58-1095(+)